MKCILCAVYWTRCQWPLVSKINKWFSFKFCLFFLLILSLYDSISAKNESWLHEINILLHFCCNSASFYNTSEKWIVKLLTIIFKRVAITCQGTSKIKHHVIIIKQSFITSKIFCHIDFNRIKENLNKNQDIFLKPRVTDIWSIKGRRVCISQKLVVVPKMS